MPATFREAGWIDRQIVAVLAQDIRAKVFPEAGAANASTAQMGVALHTELPAPG